MEISIHNQTKTIPSIRITDRVIQPEGYPGGRIVSYLTIDVGDEQLNITVYADDGIDIIDARIPFEEIT